MFVKPYNFDDLNNLNRTATQAANWARNYAQMGADTATPKWANLVQKDSEKLAQLAAAAMQVDDVNFPSDINQIEWAGQFLLSQLTKYQGRFYELDEAEFWGLNSELNFHSILPDLPLGLEQIEFFTKNYFGQSALFTGNATDIPVVNVQIAPLGRVPVAIFINAANWNFFQLQREAVAQSSQISIPSINVISESQAAAAEYMNRRQHYVSLYGIPERGIKGIYNLDGVYTMDIDINLYDPAVTPQMIYEIFLNIIQTGTENCLVTNSMLLEVKIPERLNKRLAEPYSEMTGTTIKEMLTDPNKGYAVAKITSARENEGESLYRVGVFEEAWRNKDRILVKRVDAGIMRHVYPRRSLPVFQKNSLTWEQVNIEATSGTYLPNTNRVMYVDFKNQG